MTDLFRIKPLEWGWFEGVLERGYKTHRLSFYGRVYTRNGSSWAIWTRTRSSQLGDAVLCTSPEEGKQLAEQHWQEYIKQALVPVETEQ